MKEYTDQLDHSLKTVHCDQVEDYAMGSAPRARDAKRSSEYHFELGSDEEDTGPILSSR